MHQQELLIYYQNVRGMRTKLHLFNENLHSYDFDIIALTETWLDSSVFDNEICSSKYYVYRQDRERKRGGGVLIAVKCGLTVLKVECIALDFEGLLLKVELRGRLWYICNVYMPPSSKLTTYIELYTWI